ncbi:hypothetical protein ACF0H5_008254 [Mactra antiquata]
MLYASKTDTQCQIGISDCREEDSVKKCCSYDKRDTFTLFSGGNVSALIENCEGLNACAGWAPRLAMFPYSSYIWIQYACIDEINTVDMCTQKKVAGKDVFLKLNGSTVLSTNEQSVSCSCVVSTPVCDSSITATLVDLEFQSSSQNGSTHSCTKTSLYLQNANTTFNCVNTDMYKFGQRQDRMSQMIIDNNEEIISIKDFNKISNSQDYIMIHFTAKSAPLILDCYPPGQEARFKTPCDATSTPNTASTTAILLGTPAINTNTKTNTQIATESSISQAESTSPVNVITTPDTALNTHTLLAPLKSTPFKNPYTEVTLPSSSKPESTTLKVLPSVTSTMSNSSTYSVAALSTSVTSTSTYSSNSVDSSTDFVMESTHNVHHTSPTDTISSMQASGHVTRISTSSKAQLFTQSIPDNTLSYSSTELVTKQSSGNSSSMTTDLSNISEKHSTTNRRDGEHSDSTDPINVQTTQISPTGDVISVTNINHHTTEKTKVSDDGDNGLIIGITIGVVVIVVLVILILIICFCVRLKRKENVRRNYIRNTNIFYSIPEDFNETGSIKSDSPEVENNQAFTSTSNDLLYDIVDNTRKDGHTTTLNGNLRIDQCKLNTKAESNHETGNKYSNFSYGMPTNGAYSGETSNETINFVNDREKTDTAIDNEVASNGVKSVSFDPSVLYAKVNKEGKTKF